MPEETIAPPITYGDPITEGSIATFASLGGFPSTQWIEMSPLILSRDGSRRIIKVGPPLTFINTTLFPGYAIKPLSSLGGLQRWEGCRLAALAIPREPGQELVLWNRGSHRTAAPKGRYMVRLYAPYRGVQNTELSVPPVNHIPGVRAVRAELARISAGWDVFWHSRYVFQNHLRQQVVSRLVDGILAYGWAQMASVSAASRPDQSDTWRTGTELAADLVQMAVGPLTGDPELWARVLSRNIDVDAFRIRLDKGQVPGVDTRATPWGPTAETLISTTPTGDVNEKKVAITEWHETNQRNTEDIVLKYHDSEMQRPFEEDDSYNQDHDHDPLA